MDWKDVISKIRLADIDAKLETDQIGIVNVKIENKTYNFHFDNADAVKAFIEAKKTPELQNRIHEDVNQHLKPIESSLDYVSDSAKEEIVAATTAVSSISIAKKL